MKIRKTLVAAAALAALTTGNAFAGGFLADVFIRPFSPKAADAADELNKSLNHPVERAIGKGLDTVLPGLGGVIKVK